MLRLMLLSSIQRILSQVEQPLALSEQLDGFMLTMFVKVRAAYSLQYPPVLVVKLFCIALLA